MFVDDIKLSIYQYFNINFKRLFNFKSLVDEFDQMLFMESGPPPR